MLSVLNKQIIMIFRGKRLQVKSQVRVIYKGYSFVNYRFNITLLPDRKKNKDSKRSLYLMLVARSRLELPTFGL